MQNIANALTTVDKSVIQLIKCRDALRSPVPNTSYSAPAAQQALEHLLTAHRGIRRNINPDRPLKWGE